MGSLMAGWSSKNDETKARIMRNKSLTKEEIEAFNRLHGITAGDDVSPSGSPVGSPTKQSEALVFLGRQLEKTRSSSPLARSGRRADGEAPPSSSPLAPGTPVDGVSPSTTPRKADDWWQRSNWAFLNEPPLPEGPVGAPSTYVPQFDVAAINISTDASTHH